MAACPASTADFVSRPGDTPLNEPAISTAYVLRAKERCIWRRPGTIYPPKCTPSASSRSTVMALPQSTTIQAPRTYLNAARIASQRSTPKRCGTEYPFFTAPNSALLYANRGSTPNDFCAQMESASLRDGATTLTTQTSSTLNALSRDEREEKPAEASSSPRTIVPPPLCSRHLVRVFPISNCKIKGQLSTKFPHHRTIVPPCQSSLVKRPHCPLRATSHG